MRPSRRDAVAGAGAALAAGGGAGAATQRPNILWLVSEDNNPLLGCYGDGLARTPTIDALAAGGVLFRNAYSSAPVCAPSRFSILTGVHSEACAPANQMRARATLPAELKTYPELMRAAGYYCSNAAKTDYNCDVDPARIWDASGPKAHWRGRAAGQPFLAVFNYERTHESRLFGRTPGRVTPDRPRIPAYLPDTPDIRADYASYYNLIEAMDGELAARLAELKADGLADDTIVFYYSDNGGALPRSKRYCYDEGLRVALVAYAPPKWAYLLGHEPGSVVEAPVGLIDLAPTLLSLIGQAAPATMHGQAFLGPKAKAPRRYAFGMRNRMDERYDFVRTVTDGRWRYIRNYNPHRIWGVHGAYEWLAKGYQDWDRQRLAGTLTPAQARFFGTKPYEELYDLKADRDQITDLAASPTAAGNLRELRTALDRHMLEIVDNGFIPEGLAAEGYRESRDPKAYPLARIMALAATACARDAANLPRLQAALQASNAIERYWGALGLLMLGRASGPGTAALRKAALDPVAQVRVPAGEALAILGDPAGLDVLARVVDGGEAWPALQAMNALTALGEAARPALPAIERAAVSAQPHIRNAGRYLSAVLNGTYRPDYAVFELNRAG
ncbi:MAG: sulfatase-like hydrolase/transferase [Phenylobacterium sp.]|nr:sulfatase-like hydrolase/transferase [Phenylobacterium sp.]